MASKTLPASTGYFNKEMLDVLKKGNAKPSGKKKSTGRTVKKSSKK